MELLIQDKGALQALYSQMLLSKDLPRKVYSASKADGTLIGYVAVKGYQQSEPEIQIEVIPEYQRRGYGKKMLFCILKKLFCEDRVSTVLYRTRPDNTASIRLAESFRGVPEKPVCEAEKLLLRTYRIKDYIFAHRFSINNREQLRADQKCGCFYCLKIFEPAEIVAWIKDTTETAVCPYCGIDSVIGESTGFPMEQGFLQKMYDYWF